MREIIDDAGVQAVYDVLRSDVAEEASNWSRRFKANQEKMASGSVYRVSEVVRDLWRREQAGGVSAGEKRMLLKARQILVSELARSQGHRRGGLGHARRGPRLGDLTSRGGRSAHSGRHAAMILSATSSGVAEPSMRTSRPRSV